MLPVMKQLLVAGFALVALLASLIVSRSKTLEALRVAGKRLLKMLPAFLTMLTAVTIALTAIPEETIVRFLGGDSMYWSGLVAVVVGSITLMPGFVAFPLAGVLLSQGVPFFVLSAFTTTMMMVGVLTYPIEKEYFGPKVTIVRNLLSLGIAVAVALATGLYFGELW